MGVGGGLVLRGEAEVAAHDWTGGGEAALPGGVGFGTVALAHLMGLGPSNEELTLNTKKEYFIYI